MIAQRTGEQCRRPTMLQTIITVAKTVASGKASWAAPPESLERR
jgi:hypothetical protein